MDKENLYYVVETGTNRRELLPFNNGTWIGNREKAEERARKLTNVYEENYSPMSIKEYEDMFTERELK